MNEKWVEVQIPVTAAAVDLLCEELHQRGCAGITVAQCALDVFVPPDPDEVMAGAQLIKAYFPVTGGVQAVRAEVLEALAALAPLFPGLDEATVELMEVDNEDWAQGWKQHFTATRIGRRLVVKPSWEEFAAGADDVVLTLDPGMAFGTGTHGTTRLCLEALVELYDNGAPPTRVLDVGTGSGILAMACAALGSERVLACDIDTEACRVARENVAGNGLQERVEVTDACLFDLPGQFEAVVANILAEENVRLAEQLVQRVAPGGWLILSGILIEKEPLVEAGFAPYFPGPPQLRRRDEWSCLIYRRGA